MEMNNATQNPSFHHPSESVHCVHSVQADKDKAVQLISKCGEYWYDSEQNPALGGKPCQLWRGKLSDKGYVQIRNQNFNYGHRLVYAALVGPIPDGLEIDHICANRDCLEPTHLEAVTPQENKRRRNRNG